MFLNNLIWISFALVRLYGVYCENNTGSYCLKNCERCGKNSERCIFDIVNCTIECRCLEGFHGSTCHYSTSQFFNSTSTLKSKAWSNIFQNLADRETNDDWDSTSTTIRRLNQLYLGFESDVKMNALDVYKTSLVFQKFEEYGFLLNKDSHTDLAKMIDSFISVISSREYQGVYDDRLYKKFSLELIRAFDILSGSLAFKGDVVALNLANLKVVAAYISPLHPQFPFSVSTISPQISALNIHQNKSLFTDSISLNEDLLKQRYKNNSIKISFKIYFNSNENNLEEKQNEFHLHKQKPKNFFFELTDQGDTQGNFLFNEFVSSNILSAVIYEKNEHSRLFSNVESLQVSPKTIENKFVRIQFIIDLNLFEADTSHNEFKCVFWSFPDNKWLTDGCFVSEKESGHIDGTNVYRKVCYCDHLTNFAILFEPFPDKNQNIFQLFVEKIISILTTIGIFVSSISYVIIISFRVFCSNSPASYKDNNLRFLYIANASCLLCGNLFFLIVSGMKPKDFDKVILCQLSATCLHFFLLSAFSFSLLTSFEHYKRLTQVFLPAKRSVTFKFKVFLCVMCPLLFAIFGFLCEQVYTLEYIRNKENCWLNSPQLYYLFVIPMTGLLMASLNLYIFVFYKVSKRFKNTKFLNQSTYHDNHLYASSYNQKKILLMLIFSFISLGVSWLFGTFITIFSFIDKWFKMFYEILFCICNGFHGLSFLIAHVLVHKFNRSEIALKSNLKSNDSRDKSSNVTQKLGHSYFYVLIYRIIYGCMKLFKFKGPKENIPRENYFLDLTIEHNINDDNKRSENQSSSF